jgi:hypothetical protein
MHSDVSNEDYIVMMEAVHISETSVYLETTRPYILESCHLHTRRRENLKSHTLIML